MKAVLLFLGLGLVAVGVSAQSGRFDNSRSDEHLAPTSTQSQAGLTCDCERYLREKARGDRSNSEEHEFHRRCESVCGTKVETPAIGEGVSVIRGARGLNKMVLRGSHSWGGSDRGNDWGSGRGRGRGRDRSSSSSESSEEKNDRRPVYGRPSRPSYGRPPYGNRPSYPPRPSYPSYPGYGYNWYPQYPQWPSFDAPINDVFQGTPVWGWQYAMRSPWGTPRKPFVYGGYGSGGYGGGHGGYGRRY